MRTIRQLTSAEFRARQTSANCIVIDVRDRNEFAASAEPDTCCLPLGDITADNVATFVRERDIKPEQTLVLLCARGIRANLAAEKLRELLPNTIEVVAGGHTALRLPGAPVSLERQVRFIAGCLVLVGVIGSLLRHPYLLGISAFVGAGLVFSGITDKCPMAVALAKMPWNRC